MTTTTTAIATDPTVDIAAGAGVAAAESYAAGESVMGKILAASSRTPYLPRGRGGPRRNRALGGARHAVTSKRALCRLERRYDSDAVIA